MASQPQPQGERQNGRNAGLVTDASSQYPNYEEEEATFKQFVQQHTILTADDSDDLDNEEDYIPSSFSNLRRVPCYPPFLQRIKDRRYFGDNPTFVVEVPLQELKDWDGVKGTDLAKRATENTVRYQVLFSKVLDDILRAMPNSHNATPPTDSIDILHEQRVHRARLQEQERQEQEGGALQDGGVLEDGQQRPPEPGTATEEFPSLLMRRYELRILPLGRRGTHAPFDKQVPPKQNGTDGEGDAETSADTKRGASLRQIRSRSMGRLVTIRGMIVRASDVKPNCVVATYSCDACCCEVYQVVENKREYLPQRLCPTQECQNRPGAKRETLHLQIRGSKFIKFQELKLQELPSQVPMGHVPRSMTVHAKGELTRIASPGDVVTIDGVFLPQRLAESGYRALKAGLVSTSYLDAHHIEVSKKSFDDHAQGLSEEEAAKLDVEIDEIAHGDDPIEALSSAIAPEIFGHEDIKRSLLLQLVGGCTRKLPDGMQIRGDINICLMGDPGVAKSQLLKHVASIAPRGVYTTGKGSSGVGLTAAVTKDQMTGEMALEGGALVLADRGICAIDEFDKMDEADRTAIHEVMEQQTVSIAKAGIVATLNARAAVLAAANPSYGRYNRNKSLSENINLPNSLLSRFDLMFLILDTADIDRDMALARHVTYVHQNEGTKKPEEDEENGDADSNPDDIENADKVKVSPRVLREYIRRARRHQPVVPPDVAPYIVEAYVNLRLENRPRRGKKANDQTAMTARQLLSILRISQALARLRFSDFVAREDVDEAIRLTHMSKASLNENDDMGGPSKKRKREDITSRIFNILRDFSVSSGKDGIDMKTCEAIALRKGFTTDQFQNCIEEYEALSVILVTENRQKLVFVNGGSS